MISPQTKYHNNNNRNKNSNQNSESTKKQHKLKPSVKDFEIDMID